MARARPVIAIDGPAGAGKSTVAQGVARALGYTLVDTGALYRAVAFAARGRGLALAQSEAIEQLAGELVAAGDLRMEVAAGGVAPRIVLGGRVVGAEIRTPELSMAASTVSAFPGVRAALLDLQRRFGTDGGVVLEGRDIGTVVFPDAEVKVFLTASAEERGGRRYRELVTRGTEATLEGTIAEVQARDRQDSERPVSPLRAASDATVIDSSAMSIDQVVAVIVGLARKREQAAGGDTQTGA